MVAEEQTAGRGRNARLWQAQTGTSLLLSFIFKEEAAASPLVIWPLIAGLALVDAVGAVHPLLRGRCGLKWPNDIVLGTSMRDAGKVAGVLIESSLRGNQVEYIIVGMGINVNQRIDELPTVSAGTLAPVSLRAYLGRLQAKDVAQAAMIDRNELLIALCHRWADWLDIVHNEDSTKLFSAWRHRLWTLGEDVHIMEGERTLIIGKAIDVSHAGALIVQDEAGEQHTIHSGDLSVRISPNNRGMLV